MSVPAVMHLIDGLGSGGAERMVVNLVNGLPRERYRPILCTSRFEGPLAADVREDVRRLSLGRQSRFDLSAIRKLATQLEAMDVAILHAHSTSLFLALAAKVLRPKTRIIWHDHYGPPAGLRRNPKIYGPAARGADAVVTVSEVLVQWARRKLRVSSPKIRYIPNFLSETRQISQPVALPGKSGKRIACVAGIRAEKDFETLLKALQIVAAHDPEAHLIVVGPARDERYWTKIQQEIARLNLQDRLSWLGERQDIAAILAGCEVGVLSSVSEGFPMVLLEYGLAALGVISTEAGQASEILAGGAAGILVQVGDAAALAQGMLRLLNSADERRHFGSVLRRRVEEAYSAGQVLEQISTLYNAVIDGRLS